LTNGCASTLKDINQKGSSFSFKTFRIASSTSGSCG